MKFIFLMVFARIKKNIGQYIMVALQIALGSGILYSALSMQASAQAQFNAVKNEMENSAISFQGSYEDPAVYLRSDVPPVINPGDYAAISDSLPAAPGTAVSYEACFPIQVQAEGEAGVLVVFIVSENYYRDFMGMDSYDPAQIYVGTKAAALLAQPDFAVDAWSAAHWNAESRSLLGAPVSTFAPLSGNHFSNTVQNAAMSTLYNSKGEAIQWSYEDAVIFPLAKAKDAAGTGRAALYAPINAANPAATERYAGQVTALLAERHPGVRYHCQNPFEMVENSYRAQEFNARLMTAISLGLLGILLFGFSGLLLLLANKRQAALAICRMCGARVGRLAGELFTEVAVVVFAGAVPGLALAAATLPLQSNFIIRAHNTLSGLLLCLLCLLLVCALVSAVGIIKVARAAPVRVLHAL